MRSKNEFKRFPVDGEDTRPCARHSEAVVSGRHNAPSIDIIDLDLSTVITACTATAQKTDTSMEKFLFMILV